MGGKLLSRISNSDSKSQSVPTSRLFLEIDLQ